MKPMYFSSFQAHKVRSLFEPAACNHSTSSVLPRGKLLSVPFQVFHVALSQTISTFSSTMLFIFLPENKLFFRRDALKEQFGKDQTRSDAWPWKVLCSEHDILAKVRLFFFFLRFERAVRKRTKHGQMLGREKRFARNTTSSQRKRSCAANCYWKACLPGR